MFTLNNFFLFLVGALGFFVGLRAPDIDLAPWGFIAHRSAWTHGPVLPVIVFYFGSGNVWLTALAFGLLPGLALHLLADAFPHKWHGGALVKLRPLPGAMPPLFSFVYLVGSAIAHVVVWWPMAIHLFKTFW